MIRDSRKVKPSTRREEIRVDNELASSSGSDNDTISSLAYSLRRVRKSVISRNCDKEEIEFIEKRFQDTSKVIYKNLEHVNHPLLVKSYQRQFRADIVSIGGQRIGSAVSRSVKESHAVKTMPVPTIDEVWNPENAKMLPTQNQRESIASPNKTRMKLSNNAVAPATPAELSRPAETSRSRRKGICRVT